MPSQRGSARPALKIRKQPSPRVDGSLPPPALFGGELDFSGYVRSGPTQSNLCFKLDLNMSLLGRSQPLESPLDAPDLFGRPMPVSDGEIPPDGKSNWLLSGENDRHFTDAQWNVFLEESLFSVRATVQTKVANALRQANPRTSLSGDVGSCLLSSCEGYWEFFSPNPSAALRAIIPLLKGFGRKSAVTAYRPALSVREETGDTCHCVSIEIVKGTYLRIYAKTNRRLRFEVAFDLKKNPVPLERTSEETGERTHSTKAADFGELLDFLRRLLPDQAASIVNDCFSYMSRQATISETQINYTHMTIRIMGAVKDESTALLIVELFRTHESLAATGLPEPLKRGIRALKKAGILTWSRDSKYRVTPLYAHALRTLRDSRDSLLSDRYRSRPSLPPPFDVTRPVSAAPAGA